MAKKTYVITDAAGDVVATHSWGGADPPDHNPIPVPPGGDAVILEDLEEAELVVSLMRGGQRVNIKDKALKVEGVMLGTVDGGHVVLDKEKH
jgi:hypothetical protein